MFKRFFLKFGRFEIQNGQTNLKYSQQFLRQNSLFWIRKLIFTHTWELIRKNNRF